MKYLVSKETQQIILDIWYDKEERLWLCQGAVCWNPEVMCKEGEEEEYGYFVEDIPEEEILKILLVSDEDLYWIDNKVLTNNQVRAIK